MKKLNRKKYVPQAPEDMSGLVMTRKKHVAPYNDDITICFPTFPGPGQRPDSNIFTEANYDAPKDWPPVGYVLRAPQVIWLSCETAENTLGNYTRNLAEVRFTTYVINVSGDKPYYTGKFVFVPNILLPLGGEYEQHTSVIFSGEADSSGNWHYVWIDGETNTYVAKDDFSADLIITALGPQVQVNGGNTTPLKDGRSGRPYWLTTSIANPYQPIFDHYHQNVFPEVKTRIEAMRKGRTWVDFIDWFDTYTDPPNNYWNKENQDFTAMYVPMCVATGDTFFSPDFLHIFIGHVSEILSATPWNGDTSNSIYNQNKFLVRNAWFNYAGYSAFIFILDVTYPSFDVAADFPIVVSQPPALPLFNEVGPVYSDDGGLTFHNPPLTAAKNVPLTANESWVAVPHTTNLAKIVSDFNDGSITTQTDLQNTANTEKSYVIDMCTDLADFGYKFMGDGSNLSADDIISLIASHYGFDPGNGKDL